MTNHEAPMTKEDARLRHSGLGLGHWWVIGGSLVGHSTLSRSFAACRAITTQAHSSFPLAFRLLSPPKRRAMDALYAFMRVTDDLADEPGDPDDKRRTLAAWRAGLLASFDGASSYPVHPALADTVRRFDV